MLLASIRLWYKETFTYVFFSRNFPILHQKVLILPEYSRIFSICSNCSNIQRIRFINPSQNLPQRQGIYRIYWPTLSHVPMLKNATPFHPKYIHNSCRLRRTIPSAGKIEPIMHPSCTITEASVYEGII
jgi:hypothetical protein